MDILTNVNKMLADLDNNDEGDTANVNASKITEQAEPYTAAFMRPQRYTRGRGCYRGQDRGQASNSRQNSQNKFCRPYKPSAKTCHHVT